MNDIKDKIIEYIKRNRVSSTEVADCLGKSGAVKGVNAINKRKFVVGNVFWIYAFNESNWEVHDQAQYVSEGDIVFVQNFDCGDRAIFGELVSKYMLLYKQANGIVVEGNLRDAPHLIKEDWPIWCKGFNPEGCFNIKNEKKLNENIIEKYRSMYNGSIAVCDDTGVVIIPKENITEEFYEKLMFIEEQEDIWFDCMDRLKMSTYEVVCLKKYKENK